MTRSPIDTDAKFCPYCGESYFRLKYKSGRYQEISRFNDQGSCGKPECADEHRSEVMKKSWDKRKGISDRDEFEKSPVDAWLSKSYSNINSVRYKK